MSVNRPVVAVVLFAASLGMPAIASAAELPAELDGLVAEGKKWFNTAGDTDLSTSDRNDARKKAWVNLYQALQILNKHWDDHPADQDRIEDRIMDVGKMVFWIKKESPMGLLETTGVGPRHEERSGGTNSAGQARQNDWPDKPPEQKPGAAPGDPLPAGGSSKPPSGGTAAPATAPEAPKGPTIDQVFKEAEEYERRHRADTAGILERYQDVMSRFPDAANPTFLKAAQAAAKAQTSLKDAYRLLRDEDPDSLKDVDSAEIRRTLFVLGQDLGSADAAVRERAARLMGLVGSGEGVYPLVKTLTNETDENCRRAMADAIVAIGGGKAADQCGNLRKNDRTAALGFELLSRLSQKNPVDARMAVKEMGAFALLKDEELALRAVDTMVAMGKEGAYGLVEALGTRNVEVRVRIIGALGATGNPKVATPLSKFMLGGDNPNTIRCREEAMKAVKSLGEPCVPYLWAGLRDGTTKAYTALALRDITGQMLGSKMGPWQTWWNRKYPDWKETKD